MNAGDTGWVLISTALVLFMTPGLALFYGGMVRGKNVLGMLMQNFFAMGLLAILWAFVVFSLAFGDAGERRLDRQLRLRVPAQRRASGSVRRPFFEFLTIPFVLFCAFQMTFAIITPALITGATADRLKFSAYAVFIARLAGARVRAGRALGVRRRLARRDGRARLRRRRGRAHQRRCGGARARADPREAQGIPRSRDAAAQPADDDDRHRHPVVRLGGLQRRLGARRQRRRRQSRS